MNSKEIIQLEYLVKSSIMILYNFLSTPSGLSEWFADDVVVKDGTYTFYWDGSEEKAKLLEKSKGEFIRLQWDGDEETDYYFEFRIKVDALTNEVALIITDFAEEDEKEETIQLWDSQVNTLLHNLGS